MNIKKILYKSFDKTLKEKEADFLKQGLSVSEELKKEKNDISVVRNIVSESRNTSFEDGFVDGVMDRIFAMEQESDYSQIKSKHPQSTFTFFKPQYAVAMVALLFITMVSPTLYSWLNTTNYITNRGETLTAHLPDRTSVKLNSDSKISFQSSFNKDYRIVFLEGEAYFNVAKGNHPFIIQYDQVTIEVLGTQFNVYAREQHIDVVVNEGVVKVGNDVDENSYKEVVLSKGQSVSFTSDEQPGTPEMISNAQIPGWIYGKFIFNQDNLEAVCKEIERKFDVEIDLAKSELESITVTGVMEADNLSDVLATISLLTERPYKFEKDKYTFY